MNPQNWKAADSYIYVHKFTFYEILLRERGGLDIKKTPMASRGLQIVDASNSQEKINTIIQSDLYTVKPYRKVKLSSMHFIHMIIQFSLILCLACRKLTFPKPMARDLIKI